MQNERDLQSMLYLHALQKKKATLVPLSLHALHPSRKKKQQGIQLFAASYVSSRQFRFQQEPEDYAESSTRTSFKNNTGRLPALGMGFKRRCCS